MATTHGRQPQSDSYHSTSTSNLFSILAIVFGGIAVLLFPIVFGIVAIILAGVSLYKKERLAKIAMVVAVLGTIAGIALGALVWTSMN